MTGIMDPEQEALLAVYHEAYEHARHSQQRNSTYFNFFLLIVGTAVAALLSILTREATSKELSHSDVNTIGFAVIAIGVVIWLISVLTMQKAELIGAHISHDLIKVRRTHIILRERYPSVAAVVSSRKDPSEHLGPNRKLTDTHRIPEPLAAFIGAINGAVIALSQLGVLLTDSLGLDLVIGVVVGSSVIGGVLPYHLWRRVKDAQVDRHRDCCLISDGKSSVERAFGNNMGT
jgi:hypothetical protein